MTSAANFTNLDISSTRKRTPYCGPTAIAIATGVDVDKVESHIASNRMARGEFRNSNKGLVVGTNINEILTTMEKFGVVPVGIDVEKVQTVKTVTNWYGEREQEIVNKKLTVWQWLGKTNKTRGGEVYLMVTRDHVFLIKGGKMVDNWNNGKIRNIANMRFKRSRIVAVYALLTD